MEGAADAEMEVCPADTKGFIPHPSHPAALYLSRVWGAQGGS